MHNRDAYVMHNRNAYVKKKLKNTLFLFYTQLSIGKFYFFFIIILNILSIVYKWRVYLQKQISIFIYFQKSFFKFFLLCIPSNINQTAVGLFWLSNNSLNK